MSVLKNKEKKTKKRNSIVKDFVEKKDRAPSFRNLRIYFIILILLYTLLAVLVSTSVSSIVSWVLNKNIEISIYIWLIVFDILLGVFIAVLIGKWFFSPIIRLSSAMKKVASGNLSVRLECKSSVNEINAMIENFNIMTKELAATEMLQSDFVSNVSHEFKTPLSVIEGYATLLQDETLTKEEQRDYADKILLNTRRLSNLVGNILLLSKVENHNLSTECEKFRLDEQIRQCIVMLSPKWEEKQIEIDASLEEVEYYGNASLLQHVWINIIDNAIKYNRAAGKIYIRLKQDERKVSVEIADEGSGISDEAKGHIYDKFYQCDSSHKSEGNGLGLSLVKRILDELGDTVRCEDREGGGTKFIIELKKQN